MEHWKQQPDKARQQQQPNQQQQQVQVNGKQKQANAVTSANHHHHHNNASASTTTSTAAVSNQTPATSLQPSDDPIQSIANVLNHHHSKSIQEQKKLQQQQLQQIELNDSDANDKDKFIGASKNKLEQSLVENKPTQAPANGNSGHLAVSPLQAQKQRKAKKGESSSQDSSSSFTCSHISNQVDQGNSYLYAYNDFVASTRAAIPAINSGTTRRGAIEQQQQQLERKQVGAISATTTTATTTPALRNYLQLEPEALVDSEPSSDSDVEADEALSYILHQQHQHQRRPHNHHDLLQHHIECANKQLSARNHGDFPDAPANHHRHLPLAQYLIQAEQSFDNQSFEINRIDHHLSCSRSSHPRHICGIGGPKSDHSNHLAARLKEESQRAFLLNQKHRSTQQANKQAIDGGNLSANYQRNGQHNCISEDITAIQSHNFTHELNVIQDQLAYELSAATQQQRSSRVADKLSSPSLKYLDSASNELRLIRGVEENLALCGQQQISCALNQSSGQLTTESSSSNTTDQSRPTLLGPPQQQQQKAQSLLQRQRLNHNHNYRSSADPGYLNWLFCCICNLLSPSAHRQRRQQQHQNSNFQLNSPPEVVANVRGKTNKLKRKNKHSLGAAINESSSILTMYSSSSSSQQQLNGLGQAGAYYAAGQQADHQHHHHATAYANHHHGHHVHHHHYPLSSDSSLTSSVFASSAMRMGGFFKSCCSKKCLLVSCLMLIVLIFIFVIGLSAYLNFLINLNKTNLMPLSGRLRVETQGDTFNGQLSNRTSIEFLTKQQQYETILRGAFDRTQNLLKSYPNHLVKCEVYAFKQGSLWVHFRLFINKRTLMLDNQLMKRKSPDESLDKQFLPRLTQQTLHSGFEQLMNTFSNREVAERRSRSSQMPLLAGVESAAAQRQSSSARASAAENSRVQRENVKSFDEQISRLMPIIESIDLQSIQVAPEFDMLQSLSANNAAQQSTSENLRALQPYPTSSTSAIMVATGPSVKSSGNNNNLEYDLAQTSTTPATSSSGAPPATTTAPVAQGNDAFTFKLQGYKENATRPTTSSRPAPARTQPMDPSGPFLVGQQRKPTSTPRPTPGPTRQSTTVKEIAATRPSQETRESPPRDKVVKLVSGQPVGRNNPQPDTEAGAPSASLSSGANRTIALFSNLQKQDTPSSTQPIASTTAKAQSELSRTQMVAPYQEIAFSGSGPTPKPIEETSIQELWNNAVSNKKNVTKLDRAESEQPKRLVNAAPFGADGGTSSSGSNWNKVSVFSPDVSNTIRANINSAMSTSTSTSTSTPTSTASSTSERPQPQQQQKPKVAPHLHQGGSLISTGSRRPQDSAVLLSKDFSQANSDGRQLSTIGANSSGQQPAKPSRKPQAGSQKIVQKSKQQQQQKVANKLSGGESQQLVAKNENNGTLINSKGIRIVDNFLASIESANLNATLDQALNQSSGNLRNNSGARNKTSGFQQQTSVPTLPTTIELTRSTTGQPPLRSTSLRSDDDTSAVEYTTTTTTTAASSSAATSSSAPKFTAPSETITESPPLRLATSTSNNTNTFSLQNAKPSLAANGQQQQQQPALNSMQSFGGAPTNRPGTTNFSNQWKPIAGGSNSTAASSGQRKPNLSLIIGTERLPATLNAPANQGSQSPFAMSTAIFDSQFRASNGRNPNRSQVNKQLANTYHAANNEFESHRMSRMRQGTNHDSIGSSTSTTTTTGSSLGSDSNTRLVDDFMITTDKVEGNTRGTTLLPPLLLSGLQRIDPLARMRALNPVELQPRRTRGPFAFETLKALKDASPTEAASGEPASDSMDSSPTSRAERSPKVAGADQRLLVRKKLFLGGTGEEEAEQPAGSGPGLGAQELGQNLLKAETGAFDRFGRRTMAADRQQDAAATNESAGANRLVLAERFNQANSTIRCQYYGCKAKGSLEFTCLNNTQICDDFIDCQDESDELDCVSLLKHDSKFNRLSFSNGEGIIYLNRKGSLAPMCIDYFSPTSMTKLDGQLQNSRSTNTAHDLDAIQIDMAKKQQELIRQINTIGQYACSLQSFSRLVSVKINHHSLVDDTNSIRNSKLFHRLSIVGQSDKSDKSLDASFGSYKSAGSDHEVEISTSNECPSQRTVFVKCGGFDCGQDTFSVIDPSRLTKKRNEVILNDFPWLVKLYWQDALTCHGYLIDESWLITSEECFANKTVTFNADEWTAEISYEHYGNDDYRSIETNRRRIQSIIQRPQSRGSSLVKPSIVLAKLEKPVRFSPLNRPICMPTPRVGNKTTSADLSWDKSYKDCVSVTLPVGGSSLSAQDLLLNKVQVLNANECLGEELVGGSRELICVSEIGRDGSRLKDVDKYSTHVLICSTIQASRARPKWTIVGVQNKALEANLAAGRQVFTTVSGQIDWIVDTMNPKTISSSFDGIVVVESNSNSPIGDESSIAGGVSSQTCNMFRCSSGECLSWSRICDGLYDCSSHDDEKDCHK